MPSATIKHIRSSCKVPDIFCLILKKSGVSLQTFTKVPKSKFHENPTSKSRDDMCGLMDTKLKSAYHNSANAPDNGTLNIFICLVPAAP